MNEIVKNDDGTYYVRSSNEARRTMDVKTRDRADDLLELINKWGWSEYNNR